MGDNSRLVLFSERWYNIRFGMDRDDVGVVEPRRLHFRVNFGISWIIGASRAAQIRIGSTQSLQFH
jgi:hypothetical protein